MIVRSLLFVLVLGCGEADREVPARAVSAHVINGSCAPLPDGLGLRCF